MLVGVRALCSTGRVKKARFAAWNKHSGAASSTCAHAARAVMVRATTMALGLLWMSCSQSGEVDAGDSKEDSGLAGPPIPGVILDPVADFSAGGRLNSTACLTEVQRAKQRPVAIYLMLDSSRSMENAIGAGSSKWDAIQRAIRTFLSETQQSDLSIGLQYFPLLKPGSSFSCTSHSDCGENGGPCYLSTCEQGDSIVLCRTAADCPGSVDENPCLPFGVCSESDPNNAVACILGRECLDDAEGSPQGRCVDFERFCTNATECNASAYQRPAVGIGTIAERVNEIDQSLSRRPLQGLTPTAPALEGAIAHAREWATAHPEQTVVVVLATDGIPTECGDDLANIVSIAETGVNSNPEVRTLVFGVFQLGDALSINNVNQIARAGDTDQALLIDTQADVNAQFLKALRSIRGNTFACEFQLSSTAVNYDLVNLEFKADPDAEAEQLTYVESASECDPRKGNWHYDIGPDNGTPTRIEVCPGVCTRFKAAVEGELSLQIGCKTLLR